MLTVLPLLPGDVPLLGSIQPEGWDDIRPSMEFYTAHRFCSPVKVMIDDAIVGVGTTIRHQDVAWLAHIIVHQDYRNRGIGRFITETLIDSLAGTGVETIYLTASAMGEPVYVKLGFMIETEYLFFKEIDIEKRLLQPENIEPYKASYRKRVIGIDRENSGEDRIVHLEIHFPDALVYRENSRVDGCYLPTLGNGLISAATENAGLALLHRHLQTNQRVCFPKENTAATRFLYDHGFREFQAAKRMRLGKARKTNLANIYNRIGGNLG